MPTGPGSSRGGGGGTDPRRTVSSYVARAGRSNIPAPSRQALERLAAGRAPAGFWDRALSPFTMIEKNLIADPLEALLDKNWGKLGRELLGGLSGTDYAVDVTKALAGRMTKAEAVKAPSNVLADWGWEPNFVTGLGLDIGLDPLTWLSLGTAFGAKASVSAATRGYAGRIATKALGETELVGRIVGLGPDEVLRHKLPVRYLEAFAKHNPEMYERVMEPGSQILRTQDGLNSVTNAVKEAIHSDVSKRLYRRGSQALSAEEFAELSGGVERGATARQFRKFNRGRNETAGLRGFAEGYNRPLTTAENLFDDVTQEAVRQERAMAGEISARNVNAIARPADIERAGYVFRFRPFSEGLTEMLERNVFGGKTIGVTRESVERMLGKTADPVIRSLQWALGTSTETATKWKKLLDDFPMLGKVSSLVSGPEVTSVPGKAASATTQFFDKFRKGAEITRDLRAQSLRPELEGLTGAERLAARYGHAQGTKQYAKSSYEQWVRSGLNEVAATSNYITRLSHWARQENSVLGEYFPAEGATVGGEAGVNFNGHQLVNDLLEADGKQRRILLEGVRKVDPEAEKFLDRYTRVMRATYDEAHKWRQDAGYGRTYMDNYASHLMTQVAKDMRAHLWQDGDFLERAKGTLSRGMEKRRGMRESINTINEESNAIAHELAAENPEIAEFLERNGGRFDFFESNPLAVVAAHSGSSKTIQVQNRFYESVAAMSKAMGWNERANHPNLVEVKFPWHLRSTEREQAKLVQRIQKAYRAQHRVDRQLENVQAELDHLTASLEYTHPHPDVVRREKELEAELAKLQANRDRLTAALKRDVGPGSNRQQAAVKARQAEVDEETSWLQKMASSPGEVSPAQAKKMNRLQRAADIATNEVDAAERTLRQAERKANRIGPGQAERARKYQADVRRAKRDLDRAQKAAVSARDEITEFLKQSPGTRIPYPDEEEILRLTDKVKTEGLESLTPAERRTVDEIRRGPAAPTAAAAPTEAAPTPAAVVPEAAPVDPRVAEREKTLGEYRLLQNRLRERAQMQGKDSISLDDLDPGELDLYMRGSRIEEFDVPVDEDVVPAAAGQAAKGEPVAGEVTRKTVNDQDIILVDVTKGGDWIDDGEAGRWITFNEDTGEFMAHKTKKVAVGFMDEPETWSTPRAAAEPVTKRADPEYAKAYEAGWRYSQKGKKGLEHGDSIGAPEAWYDGYHDFAADRAKWHSAAAPAANPFEAAQASYDDVLERLDVFATQTEAKLESGVKLTEAEAAKIREIAEKLTTEYRATRAELAKYGITPPESDLIPTERTIKITLPKRFYEDHVSRDLPAGEVMAELKREYVIMVTPEEYHQLLSDAKYYADPDTAGEMGPDFRGLRESAKASVKRLEDVRGVPKAGAAEAAPKAAREIPKEAVAGAQAAPAPDIDAMQERLIALNRASDEADDAVEAAQARIERLKANPKTESARRDLRAAQRAFETAEARALKAQEALRAHQTQLMHFEAGMGEFPQFGALADELEDPFHPSGYGRPLDAPHVNAVNAQRRRDLEATNWLIAEGLDKRKGLRVERKAGMSPYQLQDHAIADRGLADAFNRSGTKEFSNKRFTELVEGGNAPFQSAVDATETGIAARAAKLQDLKAQLEAVKAEREAGIAELQDLLHGAKSKPTGVRWGEEASANAAEAEAAATEAIDAYRMAEAEVNQLQRQQDWVEIAYRQGRAQDANVEAIDANMWRDLQARKQVRGEGVDALKGKRRELTDLRAQMEDAISIRDETARVAAEAQESFDVRGAMRAGEGDLPVGMGTKPGGEVAGSGVFAPKELAKMVASMSEVREDPTKFLQFYRRILGTWKGLATAVFPFSSGFTIRNMLGNVFNAYMAGVRNPGSFKTGFKIQWALAKSLENLTEIDDAAVLLARVGGDLRGSNLTPLEQAIGMMSLSEGVSGTAGLMGAHDLPGLEKGAARSVQGITKNLTPGRRDTLGQQVFDALGGKTVGRAGRMLTKSITQPITAGLELNSLIENSSKIAVMVDAMDKGADMRSAAMHARISMVDYDDLTEAEQKFFRNSGLIPFYSWLRKESALMMNWMMTQPQFFHKTLQIQDNAWRQWSPDSEFIPGYYYEQGFPIPPSLLEHLPQGWQEQMRLFAPDLPMFGVGEAGQGLVSGNLSQLAGNVGPAFQTPMALLAGKNLFSQSPLDERGREANILLSKLKGVPLGPMSIRGTTEGGATYSAKGEYLWEQLLPVLAKVRTVWPTDDSDKEKAIRRRLSLAGIGVLPFGEQTEKNEAYRRLDSIQQLVNQLEAQGYQLEKSKPGRK